jgi:pyrroloquinoline quinone biosynthesis protein B
MRIVILGSAAGGGSPQWNCRCRVCDLAWNGDKRVIRRTQSSLAVSVDDEAWCVVDCSPDIREQISACKWLQPSGRTRGTPIRDIVLTSGDIDHIGGLLSLRERGRFSVLASTEVLEILDSNPIYDVLDREQVSRQALAVGQPVTLASGATIEVFPVPGKEPLYLEGKVSGTGGKSGYNVGMKIAAGGASVFYVPGCAAIDDDLAARIRGAGLVVFDGTLWADDEMIASGTGHKTGRRMGHMPVSGADGSLSALEALGIGRLIYTHINNTNPILIDGSPERRAVEAAEAEVAYDGMEITL